MTDIDSKRQALATLDSRLAAGEIGGDEYERLRTLLTSGLTPDQCARLGVTSTPAPRSTSGVSIGPSGGQTRMPTLAELELAPGTILLDQWKIVREVGRGGFGAVFEADDIKLDRKLAVKVLDPSMAAREELLARFRREVTLMRELSHERIVRVFDYREEASENLALITMEYVNGCSVRDLLALARASKEKVSVELTLAIFEQTLEALAAAHARGVIHRDVTPGNILLAGGRAAELLSDPKLDPRIKLVDFGIAGLVERTELSAKSRVLGTAAYVAPEVLDPDAEITPEADVFGAGAVVYELLTGKTPMVTGYRPVKELRDDVPPSFAEVITETVRPEPGGRPSPMGALRALKGCRAHYKEACQKQKMLGALHSRVSLSVRVKAEAELKEACGALRELLGPDAESDEHLSSGEKWLALWEEERKETEERKRQERIAAEQRRRDDLERRRKQEAAEQRRRARQQRRQNPVIPSFLKGPVVPPAVVVITLFAVVFVVVGLFVKAALDELKPRTPEPTPLTLSIRTVVVPTSTAVPSTPTAAASTPVPRPTSSPSESRNTGEAWADPGVGMKFRYVPAGSFEMGSPSSEAERASDERQHRVALTRGYWMGETEVTQSQWRAVMGTNPSKFSSCGESCPVEDVSWFDAVAFANAMSRKAGFAECYRVSGELVSFEGLGCGGYRLPTEAEWEYAARAGTTTPFWTGGNLTTDQANYNGNYPYAGDRKGVYREKTVPVRSFAANGWGLYEVNGNVWEWVWDWYGDYPSGAVTDPTGPSGGSYRVRRGGGSDFISGAGGCRSAFRFRYSPGDRNDYLGLRLVRTAE